MLNLRLQETASRKYEPQLDRGFSPQPKSVFCQFSVLSYVVLPYERMQQRPSDPLELALKVVLATCGCWELIWGPLEEREVSIPDCRATSPGPVPRLEYLSTLNAADFSLRSMGVRGGRL